MAYIFRKVNNLVNPAQQKESSAITPDSSGVQSSPNSNPYQVSNRNPSRVFEANKQENLGGLDTGLSKSLKETRQGVQKSTQDYTNQLNQIKQNYAYRPEDINTIDQEQSYANLSKVLAPQAQQAQLNVTQSNTGSYAPNTQGVQQAQTKEGLTSLLKNQYGTTTGMARLDALLARNSGQAGEQARQQLGQITEFNKEKANALGGEQEALNQAIANATANANLARTDLGSRASEFQTQAQQAAAAKQKQYDDLRNFRLKEAQDLARKYYQFNDTDTNSLRDMISQRLAQEGLVAGPATNLIMPDYIEAFNPSIPSNYEQYLETPTKFEAGEFIDPRYNKIASLLGQGGMTQLTPQDEELLLNEEALRNDAERAKQAYMQEVLASLQGVNTAEGSRAPQFAATLGKYATNPIFNTQADILRRLGIDVPNPINDSIGDMFGGLF